MLAVPALRRRGSGAASACKALIYSCGWPHGATPAASRRRSTGALGKAACPAFSGSTQPAHWCRRLGAILSQSARQQRAGIALEPSGCNYCCQECKAGCIQLMPWYPCQRLCPCLLQPQYWHQSVAGTLLSHARHKNWCQALNNSLAQCQWLRLRVRPRQPCLPGIQSRSYSHSVAGQRCAFRIWELKQLTSFAPATRVGICTYQTSVPAGIEHHVVDLRSDTVTQPSLPMRQAMAQAKVGDDDYGEDPTVNELQSVVADLLGKEAALFVPTATMANLIAVMCHCRRRGTQLLLGRKSHIHVFEHGGVAQVAGIHSETFQDLPDGTMSLDELKHKIQESHKSQYHPQPQLICLENTHCSAGGRVLPLKYLQEVHQLAQQYGLQIHMDGARLLNAAVSLGVLPSLISQHCDSITLCLSKGVGAPVGALLAGSRELIAEAWCARKLLGGGMRQAGVLAAAALIGLSHMEETLQRDHNNARCFAQGVCDLGSPLCFINPALVETNIVMMAVSAPWLSPAKLCELMETVSTEEVAATGQAIIVRLFPWDEHCLRAVWHCGVSAHETQMAENKLRFILDKCEQEHAGML
ncbi:uncharacterized protein [Tiliqua scincoides]|uniref:uncharacterized protein n=1 Tax=Tiliqua scincoides TaxID=71010 RepID=UPI0034617C1B